MTYAWIGPSETDSQELDALSAYLRGRTAPTTVAPEGTVPVGGPADRDPGRAVLGVAPFAISDGDGPFDCCRPGSGEADCPTAAEPRPVRFTAVRRIRRRP